MKRLTFYLLAVFATLVVGCEKFDDSALWDKINSLEGRIAALEQLCSQMNTNITSLQTVVEALQDNDYVTNIAPITQGDKTIGYTITFSKSGSVTIYHGKDGLNGTVGKDGVTPVVGVKKADDGIYYWTINGEWLLDSDGNKIKAQGIDGENGSNGKNGTTPKLKIENGYWKVSYDGGSSWDELGQATGEDGDSMFADVSYDDDYVYITLNDGTDLVVPRTIVIPNNQICYTSSDGEIVTPYITDVFGANIISNVYENGKGVITFDGNITSIGDYAFSGCSSLASITIPNSVTSIEDYVFASCRSLTSVTIPGSVRSIGINAFNSCTALTDITIGEGVASIGINAFSFCTSLTSITIPSTVTSIGNQAFYYCSSLASIYCKPTTPPELELESYVFDYNASGRKIYVPSTSVTAYINAPEWRGYAEDIEGYDYESNPGNGSVNITIGGVGGNGSR